MRVLEVAYLLGYKEEEVLAMPIDQFGRWSYFLAELAKSRKRSVKRSGVKGLREG